jgi:hypothetical protein
MQYYTSMLGNRDAKSTGEKNIRPKLKQLCRIIIEKSFYTIRMKIRIHKDMKKAARQGAAG